MTDELTFQEKGHKYFLGDEEIPSVSELTRFLSREVYGEADPIALERAAEKGTAIHKATQTLDETGEVEVDSEYDGYLAAYVKFHQEHSVEWERIEWQVHKENKYAGTIDRYGLLDGQCCIVDIKTGKSVTAAHKVLYSAAQTLYAMAIQHRWIVDKLYILHLKADGAYKLIELPFAFDLADSCIVMQTYLASAKRKKTKKRK